MSSRTVSKKDTINAMSVEDPAYKKTPSVPKQVLYWAYAVTMTILLAIFISANMQLKRNDLSSDQCLLFWKGWNIARDSPTCAANINASFIGFVIMLALTIVRVLYVRSGTSPGKVVTLLLAIIYTCLSLCALAFAIVYTAGVRTTCQAFVSDGDCAAGLFDAFKRDGWKVDSALILQAAIASIWLVFGSFTSFSIYEWSKYRKFN